MIEASPIDDNYTLHDDADIEAAVVALDDYSRSADLSRIERKAATALAWRLNGERIRAIRAKGEVLSVISSPEAELCREALLWRRTATTAEVMPSFGGPDHFSAVLEVLAHPE